MRAWTAVAAARDVSNVAPSPRARWLVTTRHERHAMPTVEGRSKKDVEFLATRALVAMFDALEARGAP